MVGEEGRARGRTEVEDNAHSATLTKNYIVRFRRLEQVRTKFKRSTDAAQTPAKAPIVPAILRSQFFSE